MPFYHQRNLVPRFVPWYDQNVPRSFYIQAVFAIAIFGYLVFSVFRSLFRMVAFFKNSQISVSGDSNANKTLHLNLPSGGIDLQVHEAHDPGLETIPKYPGAMPVDPHSECEMKLHFAGKDGTYVAQEYWTADPFDVVVSYYRREFPTWQEDRYFMSGEAGGFRCEEQTAGRRRCVEVRCDALAMKDVARFPDAHTVIKYLVMYQDYQTNV